LHRFQNHCAHLLHFRAGRFTLDGLFAQHVVSHGNVADQTADIDAELALKVIEVLTIAMPVPCNALFESMPRNRFDPNKTFHHRVFVAFFDRCQGQPAIAHDDCGDAVLRLAGTVWIPEHLRIQMGVVIDESWRNR
jgi:hypothetical protein